MATHGEIKRFRNLDSLLSLAVSLDSRAPSYAVNKWIPPAHDETRVPFRACLCSLFFFTRVIRVCTTWSNRFWQEERKEGLCEPIRFLPPFLSMVDFCSILIFLSIESFLYSVSFFQNFWLTRIPFFFFRFNYIFLFISVLVILDR